MPSTTPYNFADVVLVGFPFTNLQTTKKRPAVIISSPTYQQNRPDVILMAITSQIRQPLTTGEALLQDWQAAGLVKPSVLKPLIATIEQRRIDTRNASQIADRDLLNKMEAVDKLPEADKATIKAVLDSFILKSRFEQLVHTDEPKAAAR